MRKRLCQVFVNAGFGPVPAYPNPTQRLPRHAYYSANLVVCEETGAALEYRGLEIGADSKLWLGSASKKWAPSSRIRLSKGGYKHNAFLPCTQQTMRQENNIPQHCCKCAPTKRRPISHPIHRRRRQVRLSRPHRHQNCRNPNRQYSVQRHNLNQRWPIHVY